MDSRIGMLCYIIFNIPWAKENDLFIYFYVDGCSAEENDIFE